MIILYLFLQVKSQIDSEIVLDGVKKDMVSTDFEYGFGPYSFMPGLNGSATFEIETENSGNNYLRWNSRKLGKFKQPCDNLRL